MVQKSIKAQRSKTTKQELSPQYSSIFKQLNLHIPMFNQNHSKTKTRIEGSLW